MCKSRSEGGQRCAAHTRPAYERALASGDPDAIAGAASEYATTPSGRRHFQDRIDRIALENGGDPLAAENASAVLETHQLKHLIEAGRNSQKAMAESAGLDRGYAGNLSAVPTDAELLGFTTRQVQNVDFAAFAQVKNDIASAHYQLSHDGVEQFTVTSTPTDDGYQLDVQDITFRGRQIHPRDSTYSELRQRILKMCDKTFAPETRHQLAGDICSAVGMDITAKKTKYTTRHPDRVRDRLNDARRNAVHAGHVAVAYRLPDGVDKITYKVTRVGPIKQFGPLGFEVTVTAVRGPDGKNAEDVLSRQKARALVLKHIGFGIRHHASERARSVKRGDVGWRPTPEHWTPSL